MYYIIKYHVIYRGYDTINETRSYRILSKDANYGKNSHKLCHTDFLSDHTNSSYDLSRREANSLLFSEIKHEFILDRNFNNYWISRGDHEVYAKSKLTICCVCNTLREVRLFINRNGL